MMHFSVVPLEKVISITPAEASNQDLWNIFEFDKLKCLLSCSTWMGKKRDFKKSQSFSMTELVDSGEKGCKSCKFFKGLLDGLLLAHLNLCTEDLRFKWLNRKFLLEVENTKQNEVLRFQFFTPKESKTRIIYMPVSNFLIGDTSTPISFGRALKSIETCESSHGGCGAGRNELLPKRLLDITPIFDSSGTPGIKLVETDGKSGTYACLSHCWGNPTHILSQTKVESITQYLQFIPWSLLPKTFQDAVSIARKLDLQYIWIDSLCIIQDSKKDWEIESSKMGDIYRRSFITIAAVLSSDSRGGCFSKTAPDKCLSIEEKGHLGTFVGVRECHTMDKIDDSPLFTRAWVYQERLLSRRLLYCARNELQVGCQESFQCECASPTIHPHTVADYRQQNVTSNKKAFNITPHSVSHESDRHASDVILYRNWRDMVMVYSKLKLTKEEDKLPALSACANLMGKSLGDKYLAGLWRKFLMEGLLWFVDPQKQLEPRPKIWRAPSWSWASVNAPNGVVYITPGDQGFSKSPFNRIEVAKSLPAGADSTGQVETAIIQLKATLGEFFLRLRCPFCIIGTHKRRVRFEIHTAEASDITAANNRDRCRFLSPGVELRDATHNFFGDFYINDLGAFGFTFGLNQRNGCKLAPLFLLHIHSETASNSNKDTLSDHFLVLREVDSGKATFERLGLTTLTFQTTLKRDAWFAEVWPSIATLERVITLI
ncbi:heterokaryon incompatibility protein-domain-containing protein [Xylogone sp. PMI_703]|nr:heterokaryon incompatibility protein-domain-containing protein [Xylogone sp. PMI_703]